MQEVVVNFVIRMAFLLGDAIKDPDFLVRKLPVSDVPSPKTLKAVMSLIALQPLKQSAHLDVVWGRCQCYPFRAVGHKFK